MARTADFASRKLATAILQVMDRAERKFQRAFIDLLDGVVKDPAMKSVLKLVASGEASLTSVELLQAIEAVDIDPTVLRNISRQAMAAGGRTTAKTIGFDGSFEITNSRAVEYARNLSADLIVNIKKTVRQNIRDIIGDAVAGDTSTTETVRRIKDEVGLAPRDAAAVRNYRKQLTTSGYSKAQVASMSQKYADRLLKARAKTIARTEIAVAVNTGQRAFWQQMKDDGVIPPTAMRVWIVADDERLCEICRPMSGETAPIDGAWQTANGLYDIAHAHPNCRCTSGLVFPTKLKKADPTGYEQWILDKGDYVGHPFRGNQWTRSSYRSPLATSTAMASSAEVRAAIEEFDALPGDTLVTVYHGTTAGNAARLMKERQASSNPRGDSVSEVAQSSGLYVAPTKQDAEMYAGRDGVVVAVTVQKKTIVASLEIGAGKSPGYALYNPSAGAVVPLGTPLSSVSKGGLTTWFREDWVDLSRPKKGGGFEPCGRPDASEGKYPKCVPAKVAASMTPEEIRSAVRRKRRAETTTRREDKKPVMVPTISKANVPADMELYNKVKAEAKAKFDVYPSAYANGWLVQEYKRRGGKYTTITKGDYPGHPFRGNQWTGGIGRGTGSSVRVSALEVERLTWATSKMSEDDLSYSEALSNIAKAKGGSLNYLSEGGSYYDYIDWDANEAPVAQMARAFTEYTGVNVVGVYSIRNGSPEAAAEIFDAVTVLLSEWPGTQLGVLAFTDAIGRAEAGAGFMSKSAAAANFVAPARNPSDAASGLLVNPKLVNSSESSATRALFLEQTAEWTKHQLTPNQATIMHEWGHVVEQNMALRAPRTAMKVQHGMASLLSQAYKRVNDPYTDERVDKDVDILQRRLDAKTDVNAVSGPLRRSFGDVTDAATRIVSDYGGSKAAEIVAESFLLAWGQAPGSRLTAEQKKYAASVRNLYNELWEEALAEGY